MAIVYVAHAQHVCVDPSATVAAAWRDAHRARSMLALRVPLFVDDSGKPSTGSPRKVSSVTTVFVNPDHVESVQPDTWRPQAAACEAWLAAQD